MTKESSSFVLYLFYFLLDNFGGGNLKKVREIIELLWLDFVVVIRLLLLVKIVYELYVFFFFLDFDKLVSMHVWINSVW